MPKPQQDPGAGETGEGLKILHWSQLFVFTQITILAPHLPALLGPRASKPPS